MIHQLGDFGTSEHTSNVMGLLIKWVWHNLVKIL
jgi:hypothetical protein